MKKPIKVVASIIENEHNEIMCALRSPQMSMPNLWEFPGGKVETDEDVYTALIREIDEELNCKIEPKELFYENLHEYDHFIVSLITIKCKIISGTPLKKEHSKLIWLKRENLTSLKWAPADIPAMELLTEET